MFFAFNSCLARYWPILLLVLTWVFLPFSDQAFTLKDHLCVMALLGFAIFLSARIKHVRLPPPVPSFFLLGLLISLALSLIHAGDLIGGSWASLRAFLFIGLALVLWGSQISTDYFKKVVVLAGTGVALFGMKQVFFPSFLNPGFIDLGKMQVFSTLGNPTYVAFFLLGSIPPTLSWLFSTRRLTPISLLSLALMAQVACLVATRSRHSIGALILAMAAVILYGRSTLFRILLAILIVVGGATIALWIHGHGILPLAMALKGRALIWASGTEIFRHFPWTGIGLENFTTRCLDAQITVLGTAWGQHLTFYAGYFLDTHNEYLEWFVGTGLLGGACFLGLNIWLLINLFRHPKTVTWEWKVGLISFQLAFIFSSVLHCAPLAFLYWVTVGYVGSKLIPKGFSFQVPHVVSLSFSVIAGVLLTLSSFFSFRTWQGAWAERKGIIFLAERDLWQARGSFQEAVQASPWNGSLRQKYATTLYLDQRYDLALKQLNQAEKRSGNPGILALKGEMMAKMGEIETAIAIFEKMTKALPNMVGPHFMLAQLYQTTGQEKLAHVHFKKALEIKPSEFNLGMTKEKIALQKTIAGRVLMDQGILTFAPDPSIQKSPTSSQPR